jgi:hypothetical protein
MANNDTEETDVDHGLILLYAEVKLGVGWDKAFQPVDFFLHFNDSELIAKMKEHTNLYARQKVGKLRAPDLDNGQL